MCPSGSIESLPYFVFVLSTTRNIKGPYISTLDPYIHPLILPLSHRIRRLCPLSERFKHNALYGVVPMCFHWVEVLLTTSYLPTISVFDHSAERGTGLYPSLLTMIPRHGVLRTRSESHTSKGAAPTVDRDGHRVEQVWATLKDPVILHPSRLRLGTTTERVVTIALLTWTV
jgi:hypothetical protein